MSEETPKKRSGFFTRLKDDLESVSLELHRNTPLRSQGRPTSSAALHALAL